MPLLARRTVPLATLLLDPGDELALVDDPEPLVDPSFVAAFAPRRSYRRLHGPSVVALAGSIVRSPELVADRILVRPHAPREAAAPGEWVVVDGSYHVAALHHLRESGPEWGVDLPDDVRALFAECPVRVVGPDTDPALVLALLADLHDQADGRWVHGQRDRYLRDLAASGSHHDAHQVLQAIGDDEHAVRRYHAYRALQQFLCTLDGEPVDAAELYPLFHAVLCRSTLREWLDWDDHLCIFQQDDRLEHFYRLLLPGTGLDGEPSPPSIRSVTDVVHLCDVIESDDALRVLMDGHSRLEDAVAVIDAGAFAQWTTRLGEAIETMRWDNRRFRSR